MLCGLCGRNADNCANHFDDISYVFCDVRTCEIMQYASNSFNFEEFIDTNYLFVYNYFARVLEKMMKREEADI